MVTPDQKGFRYQASEGPEARRCILKTAYVADKAPRRRLALTQGGVLRPLVLARPGKRDQLTWLIRGVLPRQLWRLRHLK